MQAINWACGYSRQVWCDTRGSLQSIARDRAALVAIIVLLLPWFALVFIRDNPGWLWSFGEISVVMFVFWWMSRTGGASAPPIKYPRAETVFALALVALWMVWRTAICGKFLLFLPTDFNCFKSVEIEIVPKVIEQVIVPIVVLFALGYRWRAQGLAWSWRAWWISLPVLLGLTAYGVYLHQNALPAFARNAFEYFFAAGLPEEVLFRALLLTRLEAWWRSPAWALFGAAVIFGLTHLPINYLVFTQRDWREAWITALTFQMGFGAVFAFAYQRTRNVLPLAIIHALVDAL